MKQMKPYELEQTSKQENQELRDYLQAEDYTENMLMK